MPETIANLARKSKRMNERGGGGEREREREGKVKKDRSKDRRKKLVCVFGFFELCRMYQ